MAEERDPVAENLAASDMETTETTPLVAPWLMEILVCPVDRTALRQDGQVLVCRRCERRYPVRDGVPVMIADEAESEQAF